jgi:hypothetical protein
MENLWNAYAQTIEHSHVFFAKLLESLQLRPTHYPYILPPTVTMDEILSLFDTGRFPRLADLAPAITFAILLSLIRFFLQNYLIKVSFRM